MTVKLQAHERSVKDVRVALMDGVKAQLADFAAAAMVAASHQKLHPALVEEVTGENDSSLEVSVRVVSQTHLVNLQIRCTAQKKTQDGGQKPVSQSRCLATTRRVRA